MDYTIKNLAKTFADFPNIGLIKQLVDYADSNGTIETGIVDVQIRPNSPGVTWFDSAGTDWGEQLEYARKKNYKVYLVRMGTQDLGLVLPLYNIILERIKLEEWFTVKNGSVPVFELKR